MCYRLPLDSGIGEIEQRTAEPQWWKASGLMKAKYQMNTLKLSAPYRALLRGLPILFIVAASPAAAYLPPMRAIKCPYAIASMRLHTQSNHIYNSGGKLVVLHGVDLPSMEWSNRGNHIRRSLVAAIKDWHCQIIRIPTSDARWFGQMPGQTHGGRIYRHILDQLITYAARHHVYVVFDLHWTDMDGHLSALGQHRMPGPNSIIFWRSAARRYKNFPNVLFDVYNEPHGIPWNLWLNGGACAGETPHAVVFYQATGMQRLYQVVRDAGASNIVIAGGLSWAYNDFGMAHGVVIKGQNVVYDCHVYPWKHHWRRSFEGAVNKVPIIFDEFGGTRQQLAFGRKVIAFAAAHHISWCAWSFHTQAGPVLIKNWHYQPSAFGKLIRAAIIQAR